MPFRSLNPATGKLVREFETAPLSEAIAITEKVGKAQKDWAQSRLEERLECFRRLGDLLRSQRKTLAALITGEMGKPITQSEAEIGKCALMCDFLAERGAEGLRDETIPEDPDGAVLSYRPIGVVLGIMPWNFPFWQVARALFPPLFAGNGIVLKHASNVPLCALHLEGVMAAAGFPTELFRTVFLDRTSIAGLCAYEGIHAIALTGSTEAGKTVAGLAGMQLKPTVLELGGSDPYLIFRDADLDRAARICAEARMVNGGQSCIAAKRFLVEETVSVDFTSRFQEALQAFAAADPEDPSCRLGPLARDSGRQDLQCSIDRSVQEGAECLIGGTLPEGPGFFYPPTLLTQVKRDMPVWKEETFGPVAPVMTFREEAEAIELANDTPYGLGAAIFTGDPNRALRITQTGLRAGMVAWNARVESSPSRPFGGVASSGWGREGGWLGLRQLTHMQTLYPAP